MRSHKKLALLAVLLFAFALVGCAPSNDRFLNQPAGFWAGLWHGFIIIITFIISLFTDNVTIYELSNNGNWYNLGFLLGAMISLGQCGIHSARKRKKVKDDREKEWEEIGQKVEEKVKRGIRNWVDESEDAESDWEEIGKKVEEKIKRELRNWADK